MIEMKFFDRDEVKIWIIKNQFGRRNLIPFQRGELALVLKPLVAAKAKERMEAGINQHSSPLQKSEKGKPIHTDEEIAKHAGVSRDTIRKVGADEVRKSYQAYIEKKLGNEWEFMRDWGGKLTGAVVRIAALMHAAECLAPPTDSPIRAEFQLNYGLSYKSRGVLFRPRRGRLSAHGGKRKPSGCKVYSKAAVCCPAKQGDPLRTNQAVPRKIWQSGGHDSSLKYPGRAQIPPGS